VESLKPRIALAYSTRDPAGAGAALVLRELWGGERAGCPGASECWRLEGLGGAVLGGFDADTIEMEFLDETPDPSADAVVVLSRHSASSGRPSLTTHHTGNPTASTLGGEPYTLAVSAPPLSRALLRRYRLEAERLGLLGEYEVTLEATHHGPTGPRKPIVFIEIGSTPDRWRDRRAHEAMAAAVAHTIRGGLEPCTPAVGFGETHYPQKLTRIHLDGDYCMGHIIPRYALAQGVPDTVLAQAVEKTWPEKPGVALIHKKSLRSRERSGLAAKLEALGLRVEMI
jgi:D-aminoacyl-tRNA deacylase